MKATLPDGTVLEGTHEEVTAAVRSLQGNNTTNVPGNNSGGGNHVANGSASSAVWTEKRVEALWNCLYGDQKKLIQYLLSKRTASVPDILKHLEMKRGIELAGIRSSLTRNARRVTGHKEAKVIEWTPGATDHKWYYKIDREVEGLLQQVVENQ